MPRFRLSRLFWLITFVAAILTILNFIPMARWDGRFRLSIYFDSRRLVREVRYNTYFIRDRAEWMRSKGDAGGSVDWRMAEFDGEAYVAKVPCSGKTGLLGNDYDYIEARFIVARIQYSDGVETVEMYEIPRGRGARTIATTLP